MVILEVYSKCIKIKYKTTLFSQATIFAIISGLVAVILPFIIAYKTKALWLKRNSYHEQPNIRFTGEYLFFAITNNSSLPIFCNNLIEAKGLNEFDTCSIIKIKETDENNDGKIDKLNGMLNILLPSDTHVLTFSLILFIDYRLTGLCPTQMQSTIILQQDINFRISSIYLNSNLILSQSEPLYCYSKDIDNRYNHSVIMQRSDLRFFDLKHILDTYMNRKITTHLSPIYRSTSTEQSQEMQIELTVNFPENQVYYRPGFWEVIKWAWIQYLAIYLPLSWLIYKLQKYVYENKLLLLYEASPFKKLT